MIGRQRWSAAIARRTPGWRITRRFLASIAKRVATLVHRFAGLAGGSPPVRERTKSGTGRLRMRLSASC
jgi:hypothetical protein